MSVHISALAWKNKTTTGNTRLLLLALADMANDDGVCWPSVTTLKERLNLGTDRAIRQILRDLETSGYIVRQHRSGHSNVYKINLTPEQPFTPERPFRTEQPFIPTPERSFRGVLNSHSPHPGTAIQGSPEQPFRENRNRTIIEPSLNTLRATQGGDDAREWSGDEESDFPEPAPESDPFTPEELAAIHFPAPSHAEKTSLARQQRERREQAEALITAFAQEIGGPDAPVTAGFIKSSLSAAFSLISAGATPESLRCAVRVQREQWPGQKNLTLAYIEQHWPQLSRVTPSARPPDEDSPAARAKREREAQGRATMELYFSQRDAIMAAGRAKREAESAQALEPTGALA